MGKKRRKMQKQEKKTTTTTTTKPLGGSIVTTLLWGGGRNSSFQYGNMRCCRWQNPGSATVNSERIAELFENKVHLKLFQERHLKGFPVKIILRI